MLVLLAAGLVWPVYALWGSWKGSAHWKKREEYAAFTYVQLVRNVYRCALRYNMPPRYCLLFGLDRLAQSETSQAYITDALLLPILSRVTSSKDLAILSNKAEFARWGKAQGISVIETLAELETGHVVNRQEHAIVEQADLFIKPRNGSGGDGIERWDWTGKGFVRAFNGEQRSLEEVQQRIFRLSLKRSYILQARLRNHPELEDLSNGNLIVCRTLTIRMACGTIVVKAPIMQLPHGSFAGEGWREKTIPVLVNLETGSLEAIVGTYQENRHPDTQARILNRNVPGWEAGLDAVKRAHEALVSVRLIGWDIGFTAEGPIVLEGNNRPGLIRHQRSPAPPLGTPEFLQAFTADLHGYV